MDAAGKRLPLITKAGPYSRPRFSPDGSHLALLISERQSRDEWVYDLRRGLFSKITFGGLSVTTSAWSSDGRYVIFGNGSSSADAVYWTSADGAGQPQRLIETKGLTFVSSFSNGRLAYFEFGRPTVGRATRPDSRGRGDARISRIFTVPVTEVNGQLKAGTPEVFLDSQFSEQYPALSTDGKWLAYSTDKPGRQEVYVRAVPQPASGQAREWLISDRWRDDAPLDARWQTPLSVRRATLVCDVHDQRRHVRSWEAAGATRETRRTYCDKNCGDVDRIRCANSINVTTFITTFTSPHFIAWNPLLGHSWTR